MAIILKPENLARFVFFIRGEKVMLDSDLARLYGVEARALNRDLARKIEALEKKYDEQFAVVFDAIKELIAPPESPKKQIGFHP